MNKQNTKIGVYWDDPRFYSDNFLHSPTKAYTEGLIYKETKKFLIVKDPTTIVISGGKVRNHPSDKTPLFYFIPHSLISQVVIYDK
ncbi:MAG: hypothetical protein AAB726_01620 [Patescibacteria group bacterium]